MIWEIIILSTLKHNVMKRLLFLSLILLASLGFSSNALANDKKAKNDKVLTADETERAKVLNDRLLEINEMDKSNLSTIEKKELRSEVKMIKEELAQISGGVYLSIGAIIVILLLLILLL